METTYKPICSKCNFPLLVSPKHQMCVICPGGYTKRPEPKTSSLRSLLVMVNAANK